MNKFLLLSITVVATTTVSCTNMGTGQLTGTGLGAAGGSATGAIIGNNVSGVSSTEGAIAGALIGGLAGNIVGRQQDEIDQLKRNQAYGSSGYPLARATSTPGYVVSPYAPYNTIDVRGMPRGAVVIDPSTNQRFVIP